MTHPHPTTLEPTREPRTRLQKQNDCCRSPPRQAYASNSRRLQSHPLCAVEEAEANANQRACVAPRPAAPTNHRPHPHLPCRSRHSWPEQAYNAHAGDLVSPSPRPCPPTTAQSSLLSKKLQCHRVGAAWAPKPTVPNGTYIRARRIAGQVTEHALSTQARDSRRPRRAN